MQQRFPWMVPLLVLGLAGVAAAQGAATFAENFDGPAMLEQRGWVLHAKPDQSLWQIKGGALEMTGYYKPYNGGFISHPLPDLPSGELTLDVNLSTMAGYDYYSLQVNLGNLATSFRRYGSTQYWDRYYNKDTQRIVAHVPQGQWLHLKIRYDNARQIVEYYCGDLENPVRIDSGVTVGPGFKRDHLELVLGNYGLAHGMQVNQIDHIRFGPLAEEHSTGEASGLQVYRGVSFQRLRVDAIAAALGVEPVSRYDLLVNLSISPPNHFSLERLPSILSPARPAMIVLADMPVGPDEAFPPYLRQKILADVKAGSDLVILGGLFTLNKGRFIGSGLEELLPVTLGGPWEMERFDPPAAVQSQRSGLRKMLEVGHPAVAYNAPVTPKAGAEVLAQVGGRPVLVRGRYGKGTVTVWCAPAAGESMADHPLFFDWKDWPAFIAEAVVKSPLSQDQSGPSTRERPSP